jgi:ATP-dependent RNA helicase DeaD
MRAAAIHAMGITKPTPIQRLAIPPVMSGRDVIAKAETGTGKTLAFGAPMMSKIDPSRRSVLGLVLCPTRELAQQVAAVLEKLGEPIGAKVALIVGGEPMGPQIDALKRGAQVVVGTPGRVIDLYGQKFLSFPWTEFVALDEADQMLEIGFIDDVRKILSYTPEERQTMLFSATFPDEVLKPRARTTRDPMEVATAPAWRRSRPSSRPGWPAGARPLAGADAPDRAERAGRRLPRVLRPPHRRRLADAPLRAHAVLGQGAARRLRPGLALPRDERVPHRRGQGAARDRRRLARPRRAPRHHVVNYSVPQDAQDYTHRIGRTGRAGRTGTAITLVSPEQAGRWQDILRQTKWDVSELELPGRTGRGRPPVRAPRHEEVEPVREERPVQTERPVREALPVREERPARRERVERPAQAERPARPAQVERPARPARPERPQRDEAAPRAARPAAPRPPAARAPTANAPERAPAAAPAASGDRTKRSMSTRERLQLEKEGRQGSAGAAERPTPPPRPSAPPAGRAPAGERSRERAPRRNRE